MRVVCHAKHASMLPEQDHMKSDERILGDGDFALSVLDEAKERLEERYRLQAQGYDLEKVTIRVSSELGIGPEQVWSAGKHQVTVKARNLLTIVLLGCEKAGFQYHRIIQKTWRFAAICKHFGKAW